MAALRSSMCGTRTPPTKTCAALLAGARARATLLFTCNGRGRGLFGVPDHDAGVIGEVLGARPAAGMFCAGEIGPVGNQNFLHAFTASLALFE